MRKAVVLLSGGLDSAVTLAVAKKEKRSVYALTIDYGQRHKKEILRAKRIAQYFHVPHQILKIALPWKGSALLDNQMKLPKRRSFRSMNSEIPTTYVPARNTIFLALALSWAETLSADRVYLGANVMDYSGYPDCRPQYLKAMDKVFALGTKRGIAGNKLSVKAPLLRMTKAEILRLGFRLGVPFHLTWSCYAGGKKPCGVCDSCLIREKGFEEAGLKEGVC